MFPFESFTSSLSGDSAVQLALHCVNQASKGPCLTLLGSYADMASMQNRPAVQCSLNAATKQIRSYAADAKASPTEVSSILEQRIRGVQEEAGLAETGRVLSVGYVDGYGLPNDFVRGFNLHMRVKADSIGLLETGLLVFMA